MLGGMLTVMLLLAAPALAQPADCQAVPVGPPMAIGVVVGQAGGARPGQPNQGGAAPMAVGVGLMPVPSYGTLCASPAPPPPAGDVLHGPPAPHGLLRGNGPADVLHNRPAGEVVVGPALPPGETGE